MKKLCKILFIIFLIQVFLPHNVKADANKDIQYVATILYLYTKQGSDAEKQNMANLILDRAAYLQSKNNSSVSIQEAAASLSYFDSFSDTQLAAINKEGSQENKDWKECLSVAQSTVSSYYSNASSNNSSGSTQTAPEWARGENSTETIENHTVVQSGTATSGGASSLIQTPNSTSNGSSTGGSCPSAPTEPRSSVSSEYQDPGMFSKDILINMKNMMEMVYKSLGQIFMLAHGLICFATDIAYVCIGDETWGKCVIALPNFSFLICGFIIYLVIFFLAMTIGMYFVDVSFKLGFAVLFLPITLSLWPFSPTKDKLSSNLSIVIRNAMLFAFVAMGVSYSVLLIKQGVIGNQEDWKEFWDVVDGGRQAYQSNMAHLSTKYSLDSTKVLVIIFCIIFGFKIVSSSINNYLDTIFSDSGFDGSGKSPMHHMGTQALGFVTSRTVAPALSYARDVALTQSGRAVSAVGQSMGRMAQGDFSDIKNIGNGIKNVGSAIRHPGRTFNQMSSKLGEASNKVVHTIGNAAVEVYDTANIFRHDQQTREEKTAKFRERMNSVTDSVGGTLQYGISNGNVLRHPARTLAHATIATGAIASVATHAAANITKKANHLKNFVTKRDKYERAVANEIEDNKIDALAQTASDNINQTATSVGDNIVQAGDKTKELAKNKINDIKNKTSANIKKGATAATAAILNTGGANITPEQVKASINQIQNKTKETLNKANETLQAAKQLGKGVGKQLEEKITPVVSAVDNFTRPTETTLKPSKILHPIIYPQKTYKTIKQLAQKGIQEIKEAEGGKEKTKLIIKKGGQIVLRSARATVKETTQATVGLAGKFLDGIGKSMQNNKKQEKPKDWAERQRQEAEAEEARQDEAIRNQSYME